MTTPDEVTADDTGRRVLAAEIRTLAGLVMLSDQGEDSFAAASASVRHAIAELSRSRRQGRYEGLEGLRPGSAGNERIWETHAAFGRSNPLAPPAEVEEDAGHVTGTVTFGPAWEGGPGVVYGGWLAALLDGVLGRAVISAGHLAVTRSLTVRFLRPTPLLRELTVESLAGARAGRDVPVQGRLSDGETVTCEAEATFVCVDRDRYRAKPS